MSKLLKSNYIEISTNFIRLVIPLEDRYKIVIDPETGEIVDYIKPGDRIVKKKQLEYYNNNAEQIEKDKIYEFGQSGRFTMLNEYAAQQLAKEKLTGSDYQIVLLMMSNTNYKTGLITKGNNQPITPEWVADKLKISIKTADRCFDKLRDRGIIAQSITNYKTRYYFNPYIQYKGRWIERTLYDMFKDTKWAGLKNKK